MLVANNSSHINENTFDPMHEREYVQGTFYISKNSGVDYLTNLHVNVIIGITINWLHKKQLVKT
jgi:hypothetical protein